MTTQPFDPVHTRKQAAKLLGVSVRTLRNMELRGDLQPVYVTERIVGYRDSALRRHLHERTKASCTTAKPSQP